MTKTYPIALANIMEDEDLTQQYKEYCVKTYEKYERAGIALSEDDIFALTLDPREISDEASERREELQMMLEKANDNSGKSKIFKKIKQDFDAYIDEVGWRKNFCTTIDVYCECNCKSEDYANAQEYFHYYYPKTVKITEQDVYNFICTQGFKEFMQEQQTTPFSSYASWIDELFGYVGQELIFGTKEQFFWAILRCE